MSIPGNLLTTAMAVMPHKDAERAIEVALRLDIPFWPQLPNLSYYEDMYVQAAEHFPGIVLDMQNRTLRFSMDAFVEELEGCMARFDDPGYFDVSETYSAVYHRFLDLDILSLDIYTNAEVFAAYAPAIKRFVDRGGVIVWGIVPTAQETFVTEDIPSMTSRLEAVWDQLGRKGIDKAQLLSRSLLSPATCCLVNPDREKTVESAFDTVKVISGRLREQYGFAED